MTATLYSKKARGVNTSILKKRDLNAAGFTAYISAFLFCLSGVVYFVGIAAEWDGATTSGLDALQTKEYLDLNEEVLHQLWDARHRGGTLLLVADLSGALAWFCLLPSVQSVAEVAGGEQQSATKVLNAAFLIAAVSAAVAFTFQAGMTTTTNWISEWPMVAGNYSKDHPDSSFGPLQALEVRPAHRTFTPE